MFLGVPSTDLQEDDQFNVTLTMEDDRGKTDGLEISWNVFGSGQAFYETNDFYLSANETFTYDDKLSKNWFVDSELKGYL